MKIAIKLSVAHILKPSIWHAAENRQMPTRTRKETNLNENEVVRLDEAIRNSHFM